MLITLMIITTLSILVKAQPIIEITGHAQGTGTITSEFDNMYKNASWLLIFNNTTGMITWNNSLLNIST